MKITGIIRRIDDLLGLESEEIIWEKKNGTLIYEVERQVMQ